MKTEFETRKIEKRKCLQMSYDYLGDLYDFVCANNYKKYDVLFVAPPKILPLGQLFPIPNKNPDTLLFRYDKVWNKHKSDTFPQFDFSTVDMIRQYVDLYQLPKQGLFFEHCNIDNLILLFFENYLEIWSKDDVRIEKSENVIRVIT